MNAKVSKAKYISFGLIDRSSSSLDKIASKTLHKSKVKPVKNINKNPQSFLRVSPMQKESSSLT